MTDVVHVMTSYGRGGSEQRLRDIVAALPEADHTLLVGSCADEVPSDVRVIDVPTLQRELKPGQDLRTFVRLRKVFRSLPVGALIVSHKSKSHLLVGAALASLGARGRRRLVLSLSMSPTNEQGGNSFWRVQRKLDAWIHPLVLVPGQDLAREYSERTGSPRVTVVRSSLELDSFFEARSHRPARRTACVLLYVGSLDKRKNVLCLPELCVRVARLRGGSVELIVAGEGPLSWELADEARRLGVSAAILGYQRDVPALMAAADVLVLPSLCEGLPQVLVQAAAAGLPYATTPVSGTEELSAIGLHGVVASGFGVGPLAAAVDQALSAPASWPPDEWSNEWQPDVVRQLHRELLLPSPRSRAH
jgi:glycosyltransferase involved in cell wall biosynthesis